LDDGEKTILRDLFSAQGTNQQGGTGPDSRPDHHERRVEFFKINWFPQKWGW